MKHGDEGDGASIQAIDRSAQILSLFSHERPVLRVSDVTSEVKVARTTAHRYLASLAAAGLLEREEGGGYRLGPLLVHLGTLALNKRRVVDVADPHLRDLAESASETSVLSVWGARAPVIVRSHEPQHRDLNVSIRVGREVSLDAAQTAVFVANRPYDPDVEQAIERLEETVRSRVRARVAHARRSGVALSDTFTLGVRTVAAPVYERHGRIAAAIAITGTVHTLSGELDSAKVKALIETARLVSAELGYVGPYPAAPSPA